MLGYQVVEDISVLRSGFLNWKSWFSNESTYGYANAGPRLLCGTDEFYSRIDDNDFRKLSWVAPEGSPLQGKELFVDNVFSPYAGGQYQLEPYSSLKFRPAMGGFEVYSTGSCSGYPLMRVEEMYFILAEAQAHTNPEQGKQTLLSFMRSHRNGLYRFAGTSQKDIIDEIVFQKRVELWGEGQSYFDIKRLNISVTRATSYARMNTTGRPAWMNFVIVRSEGQNNAAVREWNNPSTDGCYSPIM